MKRFADILPRVATWRNMGLAFHKAAVGKRCSPAVRRFAGNLDKELAVLVRTLADGSYRAGDYQCFIVRDPKQRVIHAAPFRDRVAHHAIMNVAGPCFERGAIHHSYACRTGRGNRAAVFHAVRHARRRRFFLKLDIRRYFDSIRHDTLRALFRRRFKDGPFLRLLDHVVGSFETAPARGLPIGTLTSQYFANFYLDGLDHWVMETLPCPAYVRYMDDFVLWHDDASVLARWQGEISAWLAAERGLEIKGAPQPTPCRDGLSFLGYRLLRGRVLLGHAARHRFRRRLHDYEAAHAAGFLSTAALQRHADALLAFVNVADCREWRRRILAKMPGEGDGEPARITE